MIDKYHNNHMDAFILIHPKHMDELIPLIESHLVTNVVACEGCQSAHVAH